MKLNKICSLAPITALFLGLLIFNIQSSAEAACTWSPNGFSQPYCTWYVDGKTAYNGWRLYFAGEKGDAYKWIQDGYITNAKIGTIGYPGDIMVFKQDLNINNFEHGHVAYIINRGEWNGRRAWTVRHANWGVGGYGQTSVEKWCETTITQCTFVEDPIGSNMLKVQSGDSLGATAYPLAGFLYTNGSIPGDMNNDGKVGMADYSILRANYGQTNCGNPADINGDCIVNIIDYSILRTNYGR